MRSETVHFAGEVNITRIDLIGSNGKGINITNQVVKIELYEDLFSPFRTVSITVRESIDNINTLALIGNNKMIIELGTPTLEPLKLTVKVYQIKNISHVKDKELVYTIKGVSWHWDTEIKTKISETFSGNCKSIAEKLVKKLLKDNSVKTQCVFDDTSNTTAFTAGFWSPIQCLNYTASTSVSSSNSASFLFYENRNGFNFRAIDSLLKAQPFQVFKRDNYVRSEDPVSTASYRDVNEDYRRILTMSVPDTGNLLDEVRGGRFGSNLVSIDSLTDNYITNPITNLVKGVGTLLNTVVPVGTDAKPSPNATIVRMNRHYGTYDDVGDATNSKSIQNRMTFFSNLLKFKMTIYVPGRTDYTVGQVVELDIPKMTSSTNTSNDTDYILSGKYLISAIGHNIKRDGHFCSIELIKNSIMRQQ